MVVVSARCSRPADTMTVTWRSTRRLAAQGTDRFPILPKEKVCYASIARTAGPGGRDDGPRGSPGFGGRQGGAAQQGVQDVRVHGLHQVMVEAGLPGTAAVLLLGVPGQGH